MKQGELFPAGPHVAQPLPKVKVPQESTSICHYCGERMPAALLDSTPAAGDDQRWAMIAPYHNFGCRWIESSGLRIPDA